MGDKGVMAAAGDDMGEGMLCSDHPYRNNPGGICAFCLQEKLGKLVSSSNGSSPFLSVPPAVPSSSSSSPSFRSDFGPAGPAAARTVAGNGTGVSGGRTKVPFLSATAAITQRKKNGGGAGVASTTTTSSNSGNVAVLKRSKSVAPRPMGAISDATTADSPRKKSFWSFLYLYSSSSATSTAATSSSSNKRRSTSSGSENGGRDLKQQQEQRRETTAPTKPCMNGNKEDQEAAVGESPGGSHASSSSFGRKVARSRSVGCGSRSFSGDFLERISTGFGDCTLRRVESHRESNNHGGKHNNKMMLHHHDSEEQRIKERMKCGGIFGGFGMISSSSTYWLSAAAAAAAAEDDFDTDNSRSGSNTARASTSAAIIRGRGGRSKSWGWAFASPMRAFRPAATSTSSSKSYAPTSNAIAGINAAGAISGDGSSGGGKMSNGEVGAKPSLLAVGS